MAFRKSKKSAPAPTGRSTPSRSTPSRGQAAPSDIPTGRFAQLKAVYSVSRKRDSRLTLWMIVSFLAPLAVGLVLAFVIGPLWLWIPIAILFALVVTANVFSRRVQKSAFSEMAGQPGAAAGVVERMRGDWRITPAVQVNRQQDVVHRVVGRPGIVLIAEGRGRGPRELLGNEVRRVRRVAGDSPLTDIVIGDGDGEVPLDKLQMKMMRLPRVIKGGEIDALDKRMRALGAAALPIPKGPMPTRMPRGKIR
jgi:hypothetical protein